MNFFTVMAELLAESGFAAITWQQALMILNCTEQAVALQTAKHRKHQIY